MAPVSIKMRVCAGAHFRRQASPGTSLALAFGLAIDPHLVTQYHVFMLVSCRFLRFTLAAAVIHSTSSISYN